MEGDLCEELPSVEEGVQGGRREAVVLECERDLGLAGKVIYRAKDSKKLSSALWDSEHAIMNIPSLCIHLDTERNEFKPNKETHLKPILATHCIDQIMGEGIEPNENQPDLFNVKQKNFKTASTFTHLTHELDQIIFVKKKKKND